MITSWDMECPICGADFYGYDEIYGETYVCHDCGSVLKISATPTWETNIRVVVENHNDYDEEGDE